MSLLATLITGTLPASSVLASAGACSVASPTVVVEPGSESHMRFTIRNASGPAIRWISINRSSSDYMISGSSVSGWSMGGTDSNILLTDGVLYVGQSMTLDIWIQANTWEAPAVNWSVTAADTLDGSGAIACSGSAQSSIQPDYTKGMVGEGISGITADTTRTSAILRWRTTMPSGSSVSYGESSAYGTSTYDPNLVTSHLVVLDSLKVGTSYHYRVQGADEQGGLYYSGDNTLLTAGATPVAPQAAQPGALSNTRATAPGAAAPGAPTETMPPAVSITTKLAMAYHDAPVISGVASDNVTVAGLDYSIDGGLNWSAADMKPVTALATRVTFSFTPVVPEDGNYIVMARAHDASGNQALSVPQTLVIDRQPPRMGTQLVAVGTQAMAPDASGSWHSVVGVDQVMAVNAVGGPVSMTVEATREGNNHMVQSFSLRRSSESGMWTGVMNYHAAGTYQLAAKAVDGVGNRTSTMLAPVIVTSAAMVRSAAGGTVAGASVTIYYRQPGTDEWVVWDGSAYGQANPQVPARDGSFGLLLPSGTYYMSVKAAGYRPLVTQTFILDRTAPLAPKVSLKPALAVKIGSWKWYLPWVELSRTTVKLTDKAVSTQQPLVGRPFPAFSLPTTGGHTMTNASLLGRPTVISVLSTWAPATGDQLTALAAAAGSDRNIVGLVPAERVSRVAAYLARGSYNVPTGVDEAGLLSTSIGAAVVPTHYVLDRQGIVRQVLSGTYTATRLKEVLAKLP